ncbi:UNVERIFIED_CONTAM: hypothetical protein NCL1_27385 [Trichonephila clavipes]
MKLTDIWIDKPVEIFHHEIHTKCRTRSMDSKSSTFKARSYKLQKKSCLLGMCHDAPKWKAYGVMSKDVVQYSNLLGQKRKFQQLMKMNESQVSDVF